MTRVLRLLAPALAALLVLAGVAATAPTAVAAAPDPTLTGAPAVGQCYDVSLKQAKKASLTETAVACSADHTLRATAVVRLPASTDMTASAQDVAAATGPACWKAVGALVGGKPLRRALTLYSAFTFVPTATQRDAGARWVSCFVGVWDARGLEDLPSGDLPRATRKPQAQVAHCLDRRLRATTCAERHRFRAVHAYYVKVPRSDRAAQPVLRKSAARTCVRKAGRTSRFEWLRVAPRKAITICHRKTRR